MPRKKSEPSFLPCVATHYRNVMQTKMRQFTDLRECIVEKYHGSLVEGLPEELDALFAQTEKVFRILDARSSKPTIVTVTDEDQAS